MDILFLLIPLSVVLVLLIGAVFWYALSSGQFDDLDRPPIDVLADDDVPAEPGRQRSSIANRGTGPLARE